MKKMDYGPGGPKVVENKKKAITKLDRNMVPGPFFTRMERKKEWRIIGMTKNMVN